MKKLIISIIAILLAVLIYVLLFENITIANWKSKNIGDIKNSDKELKDKIGETTKLNNQEYPEKVEDLEKAIKDLKTTKKEYIAKTESISENIDLGIVEVKQYKIERLWITLENYAKDCGIELILNLVESPAISTEQIGANLYDLEVTLIGSYIGITDFIYEIENDDILDFRIRNFSLSQNVTVKTNENTGNTDNTNEKQENTQTATHKVGELKAQFKIENVGIEFE